MLPRKRKAPARYESESPMKRVKSAGTTPSKRKSTPRAAKVDRNDPDWLVTNEKSPLVHEDIHAVLCDPKTFEDFTAEDWNDIAAILPDDVPRNDDGSIPLEFFKYNPDFRRGIREFQEDLGMGRLEPAWQEAAAKAMEDRAQGKFDTYKENQFEEFWGQKQKLDHNALAGESARLKLEVLIQNGIFKEGDIFSYCRTTGRAKNKTLLEKDCRIVNIGSKSLTLAFPPGRLKYARLIDTTESTISGTPDEQYPVALAEDIEELEPDLKTKSSDVPTTTKVTRSEAANAETGHPIDGGSVLEDEHIEKASITPVTVLNTNDQVAAVEGTEIIRSIALPQTPERKSDVILHEITSLQQLNDKVVEIDGRLDLKDVPAGNAWKFCRCKRNNQDLGTLFEMREHFFVYKLPQIVKDSRGKRAKARNSCD